ncbi:MAG: hypothetical protein PHW29_08680 [Flavobacterium sp.]|nr:hypothetical protein [Flavobacterium sp.]
MASWTEKVNKFVDYEHIFENHLDEETIRSIQYVSLRRASTWKNCYILVGLNNISHQDTILNHSTAILRDIRKHQSELSDNLEKSKQPKSLSVFEYSIEKKKEKQQKMAEWKNNPREVFEKINEPDLAEKDYLIYDGLFIQLEKDTLHSNKILGAMFLNDFDFEVVTGYEKLWKFAYRDGIYYKYQEKPTLQITDKIGFCRYWGKYEKTTKATYTKWQKEYEKKFQ